MEESIKVLYRELQERYVKVLWTHKIHLSQAAIHYKKNKNHNVILSALSVMVSAAAVANVLKWLPEIVMIPILAILSLALTFFTVLYRSENLSKAAAENEHFAATMHDLRNRYSGFLSDIKAGILSDKQIVEQRMILEHEENLIYSGNVPRTTSDAVSAARRSLKVDQDSTTTDDEIALLVSANLQL